LWLATFFGGLGARSRRGFGSFMLTPLEGSEPSLNFSPKQGTEKEFAAFLREGLEQILAQVREFLEGAKTRFRRWDKDELPTFPCFREGFWKARVRQETASSWKNILNLWGENLRSLRINGTLTAPDVFNPSTHTGDYDRLIEALKRPPKKPLRLQNVVLGLPLQFRSRSLKTTYFLKPAKNKSPRRASPLLLSVSHDGRANWFTVVSGFKMQCYPAKELIVLKQKTPEEVRVTVPRDTGGVFQLLEAIGATEV